MFNKFILFLRERLLYTLDSFKDIISISGIVGDTPKLATPLDEDKSCSDLALIQ